MREVVLVGPVRTAIGKFGGTLSTIPAVELGAIVIKAALERAKIDPAMVDQVLMGCVLQAGLGQNVARQAMIHAGLPVEIPATTINCVCGSGLHSVNLAASMIQSGDAEIIVAGGMENMSRSPYLLANARFGYRMNDGALQDSMVNDGLFDIYGNYHMGITAENVAERYHITRLDQDEFSVRSQQKCEHAQKTKQFADEIVPVQVKVKKEIVSFDTDEFPRPGVTMESLSALSPAFKTNGTVTAGNASGINDGAAALLVMSSEKAQELGVTPLARIASYAACGVEPAYMGIGPVFSTRKALKKANLNTSDIDLIETNEAFAAQCVAVTKELDLDSEKVNVNGGAIALGHPIGASGARILVSLLNEMGKRKNRYGLATLCVGGGMGVTTIIETM